MPKQTDLPVLPFERDHPLQMPPAYRDILDAGQVIKVRTPAGAEAWLVTRYHHVQALFGGGMLGRSHADPENAPRYAAGVFAAPIGEHATYAEDHARIRRVLARAFTARRMHELRPRILAIADRVLDDLVAAGPEADLRERFAIPLAATVINDLLGVPQDMRSEVMRNVELAENTLENQPAVEAIVAIGKFLAELAQLRRKRPAGDIMSDLLAAHDEDGKLTDGEFIRIALTLLFAGYTTTVSRIEFGSVFLLTNPVQRADMLADPGLVPRMVEEVMRFAMPTIGAIPRWARADVEVGGALIREGDLVLLGHEIAGRDAEVFPDPDRFDLHRTGGRQLGFGHGNYFCIGNTLARLELEIAFTSLFGRLPAVRLAIDPSELELRDELLVGGFRTIPVRW